jgi:predicted MPP superfamily phosphohydrolase
MVTFKHFDQLLLCLRALVTFILLCFIITSSLQNDTFAAAEFSDRRRVVAIGDLHSDYLQAVRNFVMARLIDPHTHTWNTKNTILVITGDIVDRGNDTRKLYELLRNMAHTATMYNSEVHVTLGMELIYPFDSSINF